MEPSWAMLGHLGSILGVKLGYVGASWGILLRRCWQDEQHRSRWANLEPTWSILRAFKSDLERQEAILGTWFEIRTGSAKRPWSLKHLWMLCVCLDLGGHLGPSWGILGSSWSFLGSSWGVLRSSWGMLGHLGVILGSSWGILGSSWGILGLCWGILGSSWGILGAFWGSMLAYVGVCWPILRHLEHMNIYFWIVSIFCRFWPQLRLPNPPKIDPKSMKNVYQIWMYFVIDFLSNFGRCWQLRTSNFWRTSRAKR